MQSQLDRSLGKEIANISFYDEAARLLLTPYTPPSCSAWGTPRADRRDIWGNWGIIILYKVKDKGKVKNIPA